MSRQDYDRIAATVRDLRAAGGDGKTLDNVAGRLARVMLDDNARFDVERFLLACGVKA